MTVEVRRTPAAGGGSYSDAVAVDVAGVRWVHIAGQTPRVTRAALLPDDVDGQARLCFGQIESILATWHASLADVVQITAYLTSLEDYGAFASVRAQFFPENPPASAVVGVASLLDDALVEVAAVAFATQSD